MDENGKNRVMRSFMICTPRKLYPSNQIKKDELRGHVTCTQRNLMGKLER